MIIITDQSITLPKGTEFAKFSFLTLEQAETLQQIDPELIALAENQSDDIVEINQLVQDFPFHGKSQPQRQQPEYSKLWFPTTESCSDPENLPPLQREIFDQKLRFQNIEWQDARKKIPHTRISLAFSMAKFKILNLEERKIIEELLLEFHDIFAKHRFDVGYNTELKI